MPKPRIGEWHVEEILTFREITCLVIAFACGFPPENKATFTHYRYRCTVGRDASSVGLRLQDYLSGNFVVSYCYSGGVKMVFKLFEHFTCVCLWL